MHTQDEIDDAIADLIVNDGLTKEKASYLVRMAILEESEEAP